MLDIKRQQMTTTTTKGIFPLLAHIKKRKKENVHLIASREWRGSEENEERAMRYLLLNFRRTILGFQQLLLAFYWNHEKINICAWIWKWRKLYECVCTHGKKYRREMHYSQGFIMNACSWKWNCRICKLIH